ncbi:predicted protein [Aspergillus terreus NIH2624]|uniref:Major facilitator superfamily (MFS) profile domain-containing protein n=1 Tax=Aspergillus terreus (strain NIH 2624 / FGSC A1156) TaxID=341663 RepID=Q0CPQ9_ASPTN|nr:uncharacterized protein ATEG_04325 [Aspergillus terreus NIH2624]EAU34772.1 predicted protein [Aspergillus terreus NIH2624]
MPRSTDEKNLGGNQRLDVEDTPPIHRLMEHTNNADPEIVDFEGPEDPANPMNWSRWRKGLTILALCGLRLVTPFATSMMAPAIVEIKKDLNFQSDEAASFSISAYVIGFGVGPIFLAPMSEIYGRTIVYHIGNLLFTAFTVGCALSQNIETLIVCRILAGLCGGATMTNPGGTIADMIPVGRRGAVLSILAGVDVISPVLGPSAGGYIASAWGWRWMFWFLSILSGSIGVFSVFVLRETYAPVILARKAKRLRESTGNADLRVRGQTTKSLGVLLSRACLRPLRILIFSPIILALSLYMSLVYGIIYILFTTISVVFQGVYGFDTGNAGLTFLGFAAGMVLSLMVAGYFNDSIHKKLSAKYHEEKPEFRLPFLMGGALFLPIGMLLYGWCVHYRVHWILPVIGTSFAGVGVTFCFVPTQAYIIDAFPLHCASALAGNNLLRSISGGTVPLAGPALYSRLGVGWGNTLLALLAAMFGGLPILFYKYGERLRKRFPVDLSD